MRANWIEFRDQLNRLLRIKRGRINANSPLFYNCFRRTISAIFKSKLHWIKWVRRNASVKMSGCSFSEGKWDSLSNWQLGHQYAPPKRLSMTWSMLSTDHPWSGRPPTMTWRQQWTVVKNCVKARGRQLYSTIKSWPISAKFQSCLLLCTEFWGGMGFEGA